MTEVNTVLIVSDKEDVVNQISQKLVLLRNLDKVKSSTIEEAKNTLDDFKPNVIILHCENNDKQSLELIKKVKKSSKFKNTPILFVNENCSREIVIEAFDAGISDIIFMPIIDYELLIRTIWCLQKNELNLNIESKTNFLASLGVIQSETGVYAQKYCDEFLKNQISQSQKYNERACIMLVSPDKKYPVCKNPKEFISTIKNSIRLNDFVIIKDVDEFYVYLQKTKLNGAYSVFERINNNLGIDAGANAGVVEVQGQKFEDIKDALTEALKKANENTNSLIVASDFYEDNVTPVINLNNGIDKEFDTSDGEISVKSSAKYDKNSIKLFNQAYKRKLNVVIEPVFKKYERIVRLKNTQYAINSYTGSKSAFSISSGKVTAAINIDYDGICHSFIKLTITDNGQKRLFETETLDFNSLDYRKISVMLSSLIEKFFAINEK